MANGREHARIYLDNNATTAIDPRVAQAMTECHAEGYLNPASQHTEGRKARKRLEEARDGIAEILGANRNRTPVDQVIFTSGGTESNNLAIYGMKSKNFTHPVESSEVVVSAIEHPSVLEAAGSLPAHHRGTAKIVEVDQNGVVRLDALQAALTPQTRLVSVMLGNNETGVLQPIEPITKLCASAGVPVHTDAVQAVGKIPISFAGLGVDAMSATAHKFHGPRGIGVLIARPHMQIDPLLHGGSQQLKNRPGTESVVLAVGMLTALELWKSEAELRLENLNQRLEQLQTAIRSQIPDTIINGIGAERLPHTLNCSFPGCDRQAFLLAADRSGLACSTGSACESGSSDPSHVLIAMNASPEVIESSIRISLSANTTPDEIEQAVKIIVQTHATVTALA